MGDHPSQATKIPPAGADDGSGMFTANDGRVVEIRNVWEANLEEEMANIREILETHPFVGMVIFSNVKNFLVLCPNFFIFSSRSGH